jgi:3-methyladenine DNA glycosylase Mpg
MHLQKLLVKPAELSTSNDLGAWFAQIAEDLLRRRELRVGKERLRLVEVELYYHGEGHLDPFSHRQPITQQPGLWYFHSAGRSYRGGSFKGMDITFGHAGAYGGVLIRAVERSDGRLIDGPSLCVDFILKAAGYRTVAELDRTIGRRKVWQLGSPLRVVESKVAHNRPIYQSARVGLTLNSQREPQARLEYFARPYRFLTEPRRIKKGKRLLVASLHEQGFGDDEIMRLTGCPRGALARHISTFGARSPKARG